MVQLSSLSSITREKSWVLTMILFGTSQPMMRMEPISHWAAVEWRPLTCLLSHTTIMDRLEERDSHTLTISLTESMTNTRSICPLLQDSKELLIGVKFSTLSAPGLQLIIKMCIQAPSTSLHTLMPIQSQDCSPSHLTKLLEDFALAFRLFYGTMLEPTVYSIVL